MKQKLLKTWLMLCLLLVGVGTSWADEVTFDLTTNSFSESSTSLVKWTSDHVVVILNRGTSGTNANNYLGGTGTYKHTRVYDGQLLSFVAKEGYFVSKVEVTSTSSSYNIPSTGWINASASASDAVITAIANGNVDCVEVPIIITAAKQIKSVKVTYIKDNVGNDRTITIRANNVSELKTTYGERDWTAGLVSGKTWAYKGTNGIQFNDKPYLYNTTAIPGKIKSIKMVAASGAAEKEWSVYVASEPLTDNDYNTKGTKVGSTQLVSTSGNTWNITSGNYTYFCLYKGSNATQISEITVTYTPNASVPAKTLKSISLSGQQTNFVEGDEFTFAGTVTATYEEDDIEDEDVTASTTFSGYNMATTGTQTVTASYTENGKTKSAQYEITVSPIARYTLHITQPTEGGTLTVKDGNSSLSDGASIKVGTKLTCQVTDIPIGKRFSRFYIDYDRGQNKYKATNPATFDNIPTEGITEATVRVTYQDLNQYTIVWNVNGKIERTDVVYENSILTPPNVQDLNNKTFSGWVTSKNVDANTTPTYVYPTVANTDAKYYAVFANLTPGDAESVTDILTRVTTGIEDKSTTYADWSGKSSNSDAVYAGNSAGSNNAIQLRTTNNSSGIVSTTSGGTVKKVTVEWQTSTNYARVLNIYGSNTAYTSAADLYDDEKCGTLLGTLARQNKEGNAETELTINGNYAYIGLRSADGAMYLSKVLIEWESGTADEYSNFTTAPLGTSTFTVSAGGYDTPTEKYYATYYTDHCVTVPEGCEAASVDVRDNKMYLYYTWTAGTVIPANTGVVIKANVAGTYTYHIGATDDETSVEGTNYLYGSTTGTTVAPEAGVYKFYKLAKATDSAVIGFYWGAENGAAFNTGANKAYLAIPASVASEVKGFAFGEADDATAIFNIATEGNAQKTIYNLNGQRVSKAQKGIYIVNGKKIMFK